MFKNLTRTCMSAYKTHSLNALVVKRSAGHSKWQNIRHIKGAKDAEKSALYTKLGRQMKVAIQEGGSDDPDKNLKLQQVIEQCKRVCMPVSTIQSIIKSTKADKSQYKSHLLEINGPAGCIILCEVFTDNIHMFRQNIASLLKKHKSKLTEGARHLFEEKGIIETDILPENRNRKPEDIIEIATDHAIECGAEDIKIIDDNYLQFICGATNLKSVQNNLEKLKYNIESASVEYIPMKMQSLGDSDFELCENLLKKLNSFQEVIRISDNIS